VRSFQHTLRWYERIGLLAKIERGDGRRRFSEGDLEWLSLLTKLRDRDAGRGHGSTPSWSGRARVRPNASSC
jgi:hypothetical protein